MPRSKVQIRKPASKDDDYHAKEFDRELGSPAFTNTLRAVKSISAELKAQRLGVPSAIPQKREMDTFTFGCVTTPAGMALEPVCENAKRIVKRPRKEKEETKFTLGVMAELETVKKDFAAAKIAWAEKAEEYQLAQVELSRRNENLEKAIDLALRRIENIPDDCPKWQTIVDEATYDLHFALENPGIDVCDESEGDYE